MLYVDISRTVTLWHWQHKSCLPYIISDWLSSLQVVDSPMGIPYVMCWFLESVDSSWVASLHLCAACSPCCLRMCVAGGCRYDAWLQGCAIIRCFCVEFLVLVMWFSAVTHLCVLPDTTKVLSVLVLCGQATSCDNVPVTADSTVARGGGRYLLLGDHLSPWCVDTHSDSLRDNRPIT